MIAKTFRNKEKKKNAPGAMLISAYWFPEKKYAWLLFAGLGRIEETELKPAVFKDGQLSRMGFGPLIIESLVVPVKVGYFG